MRYLNPNSLYPFNYKISDLISKFCVFSYQNDYLIETGISPRQSERNMYKIFG